MNYADLPGYTVGGTIHVVVNNLLGFNTSYTEEHSTRFAACIARRQSIPIFHVNGEDVDPAVRVPPLATQYRSKSSTPVASITIASTPTTPKHPPIPPLP